MNRIAESSGATVRRWFQAVQSREIARPDGRGLRRVRANRGQGIVQRNIADHRHPDAADEIDQAGGEEELAARLAPPDIGSRGKRYADDSGAEKGGEKGGVQHGDADRLHGRDPLLRQDPAQGRHHEGGEGEEDAGDEAAADRGSEGQGEEHALKHGHPP